MWHNNGGANYGVQLKAPPMESFVEKVRGPVCVRACCPACTCLPPPHRCVWGLRCTTNHTPPRLAPTVCTQCVMSTCCVQHCRRRLSSVALCMWWRRVLPLPPIPTCVCAGPPAAGFLPPQPPLHKSIIATNPPPSCALCTHLFRLAVHCIAICPLLSSPRRPGAGRRGHLQPLVPPSAPHAGHGGAGRGGGGGWVAGGEGMGVREGAAGGCGVGRGLAVAMRPGGTGTVSGAERGARRLVGAG